MKRRFILGRSAGNEFKGVIDLVGQNPKNLPYLRVGLKDPESDRDVGCFWVEDKDLKRLAQNILKALK